jgi:putative transposase
MGNPLRAGMVSDLRDYPWSSYPAHGEGQQDLLLSELPSWADVAATAQARQTYWRALVHTPLTARELLAVQRSVVSGRPYGAPGWVESMARTLGLALASRPRGRPPKQDAAEKMN